MPDEVAENEAEEKFGFVSLTDTEIGQYPELVLVRVTTSPFDEALRKEPAAFWMAEASALATVFAVLPWPQFAEA